MGPAKGWGNIANLDLRRGATIISDPVNHKITVQNGYATLGWDVPLILNHMFAEPVGAGEVFKDGQPLGHFSFTVQK